VVLLVVVLMPVLAYAVLFTPLLGVRSVEVAGTKALTAADVLAAAHVPLGRPMLRLDLAGIRAGVAALPRVADVAVHRSWPSTVRVRITERTPVAVVKAPDATWLVDGTGLPYAVVDAPPSGLPELQVHRAAANDPATKAGVQVLSALPDSLRAEVLAVSAPTQGDVRLNLTMGREVVWGSAADSQRKAVALVMLLTREGKVYNVTAPELATVS
jgi:cell division protein FtsQ